MSIILSIDVGTGSVKAGLLESDTGQWLASASRPIRTSRCGLGADQDAREYWIATLGVVSAIRSAAMRPFRSLRVISLTGQMRSFVPVAPDGEPTGPVLTLYDRRAAGEHREFLAKFTPGRIHQITGQRFDAASVPAKLRWFRRHATEALQAAWKILPPKDYVRLRLTGEAATDPIDASGWLLYDLERRDWDPALVEFAGVDQQQMPHIAETCSAGGTLLAELADDWGVSRHVLVATGGGDDIAATGCGVTEIGDVYEHLGSTGSVFVLADRPVLDPDMILECYPTETRGLFWLGGSCNSAGTAIEHALRLSAFCTDGMIDWSNVAAVREHWSEKAASDRPMYLPYVAGERCPVWNAGLRAVWFDVELTHSAADWAIAAHEGPTLVLAWILEELGRVAASIGTVYSAGKAGESLSFARLRATIYGRPIHRLEQPDAALFAAAMIGAVANGEARDVRELVRRFARSAWTAEPVRDRVTSYAERLRGFQYRTRALMGEYRNEQTAPR